MSLASNALYMSLRTILTCSCALLSHSKSVMEPLKTMPSFHPIPFKQGKYLSIKTRTLAKYNETRSSISERIALLETTLNKLKTQAACAITNGVNEITEHESSMPLPALLHLPLPLAEEVTHLYSKINSVQGENGFVLDDAIIYNFFHSLIAAGDYRTALVNVLHDKIIAEARGPPFPLKILEDLNYVLRYYVIPQLPCSTAHFSRIVPLLLYMCNNSNKHIVESAIDNTNNSMTATHKSGESSNYECTNSYDRRREMERVLELAVEEEIALVRSKHTSEHINGKQEIEQIEPANLVNNVDALSSSLDETQESIQRKKDSWQDSLLFSTQALTSSYEQSAHCHYIIEEFVLPIWQAASEMGLLCLTDVKELTNNNKEQKGNTASQTSVNEYQNEDENNNAACHAEEHEIRAELEKENKNEQLEELLLPKKEMQTVINKIVHCFDANYHAPLTNSIANNVAGNVQTDISSKSVPRNENSKESPLHKQKQEEEQMTSSNCFTDKLQILESVLQFYLNLACIASEVQDEHWLMEMLKLFCNICLQKSEIACNKIDDTYVNNLQGKFAVTLNVQDWCTALLHSDSLYKRKSKSKDETDDDDNDDKSDNATSQDQTEFLERVSKLLRCFASEYLAVIYYGLHSIQRERQVFYAMELQQWQSTFSKNKESLLSSLSESLFAFHASEVDKCNITEEFVSRGNVSNSNVDRTIKNDFYQDNNEQNRSGDAELQSDWQDMNNTGRNEKDEEIINKKANETLHKAMCKVINLSKMRCINVHTCSSINPFDTEAMNSKVRSVHALIKQFLTSVLVEHSGQVRNTFDISENKSANHKDNDNNDDNIDDGDDCVVTFAEPILNYILLTQDVEWLTTLSANEEWRSSLRQVLPSNEEWELYNALVKSNAEWANNTLNEEECEEEEEEGLAKRSQCHAENKTDGASSASYKHWYTFSEKLLQSTTYAIKEKKESNTNDDDKNNMSCSNSNEGNSCTHSCEAKSTVFERLQRIADGLVELFTSTHINTCTRELLSKLTPTQSEFINMINNNDNIEKGFSNFSREEIKNNNKTEHEIREYSQGDKDNHTQTFVIDEKNVATNTTVININNRSMSMTLSHFVSMLMHKASIVSSSYSSLVLTPYSITSLAFMILSNELASSNNENIYTNNINKEGNLESTNDLLSKLANIATKQLQCYKMLRAQHEQHNNSRSSSDDAYNNTSNETCETININNLEMLYTGNALSLLLLTLARRHMWDDVLPLLRVMSGSSIESNLDCDVINTNINTTSTSTSSSLASTHGKFYRSVSFMTCQSMEPVILCTLFRLARNDGACMICTELRQHREDIFF